jgi:hypothetical protein
MHASFLIDRKQQSNSQEMQIMRSPIQYSVTVEYALSSSASCACGKYKYAAARHRTLR